MTSLRDQLVPKIRVDQSSGCWNWTASRHKGYGRVGRGGRLYLAHRLVYEWLIGPIPDDMDMDHVCRNRGCVNPMHLDIVTQAENMRRAGLAVTKCRKAGHPYTSENTRRDPKGHKVCRQCERDRWAVRGPTRNAQRRRAA